MRFRRETGDYSFVVTEGEATIPANLSAEDLVGAIVINGTTVEAVTKAVATNSTTITLTTPTGSFTYTIATGAVAAVV